MIKLLLKMSAMIIAIYSGFSINNAGLAATFTPIDDKIFHCKYLMEGLIEKGDAQKLTKVLSEQRIKTYPPPNNGYPDRLCLNSPGGNLLEAIKMAEIYTKSGGTAVRAGERCESACAVLFMAGSYLVEEGYFGSTDRVIHPLGKLGFHAPGLSISDGIYKKESVEKAYNIAVAGIAEINRISTKIDIPATLVIQMLKTPPSEMMYIEKVWQAARWNINIAPTKLHPVFSESTQASILQTVCNNVVERSIEMNLASPLGRLSQFEDRADWKGLPLKRSDKKSTIDIVYPSDEIFYAGFDCHLSIPQSVNSSALNSSTGEQIWVGFGSPDEFRLNRFSFFEGKTDISSLAPERGVSFSRQVTRTPESTTYGMSQFSGYDLQGGDLAVLRNIDERACLEKCNNSAECDAITYDLWNRICIQKDFDESSRSLLLQPKSKTYVSAEISVKVSYSQSPIKFKRRDNRHFPAVAFSVIVPSDRERCQKRCDVEKTCHAYGFDYSLSQCELYNLPPEYFPKADSYIGIKEQLD